MFEYSAQARPTARLAAANSAIAASPDTAAKGRMKVLTMNWVTKDEEEKKKVEPTGQGPGLFDVL